MLRLLNNDATGAKDLFEKCVATKLTGFYEYTFAKGELARMAASVPQQAAQP
jgi:hypothetical protein